MMIAIDSSFIISSLKMDEHYANVLKTVKLICDKNISVAISLLTLTELYVGVELSNNKIEDEQRLLNKLKSIKVRILPDNLTIAKNAAKAMAEYRRRGGRRTHLIADFIIGAHAEYYSDVLVTCNVRDFLRYFKKLKVYTPGEYLETLKS